MLNLIAMLPAGPGPVLMSAVLNQCVIPIFFSDFRICPLSPTQLKHLDCQPGTPELTDEYCILDTLLQHTAPTSVYYSGMPLD